jgi:excinuclease ABC subunit C
VGAMPVRNSRALPAGRIPARTPRAAGSDAPSGTDARPQTGAAVIAGYLKTLSSGPGVYRMLDAAGNVIYVGKAHNLKARVTSYARAGNHNSRTERMIAATAAMEFVTVRTEAEALLLEANLIKRFRPRYNVLLRDDKSFPYILIARDHPTPQILKHRGTRNRKGDYFGPFASAGAVGRTINMLERAFLLRSCSDAVFESRTRPCLLHQIKRCSAPCTGEIGSDDYAALVEEAVHFLRGESQNVRALYQRLMAEAAHTLDYERAAGYRNRLWALAHVTADQTINPEGIEEADVFAAFQDGGQTCIQVFFFRAGQNWGNRAYFPRADRTLALEEVLESFIAQFYDDKPVPRCIMLAHDLANRALLQEALSTKSARRTEIVVPRRGPKTAIVEHARANAREALARRLAESSSQRLLLAGLVERFGLATAPRRIEVYDNSHTQGGSAVGAMIVAGTEGFIKSSYRKFNLKSADLTPGDDYAMMREVLTRRFKRLLLEEAEPPGSPAGDQPALHTEPAAPIAAQAAGRAERNSGFTQSELAAIQADEGEEGQAASDDVPARPDLLLIDGGPGQLAVAREVLQDLGVSGVALIGVAKGADRAAGREHFYTTGRPPMLLEPRDPVLYFVQRLRDEAHRFAVGTHRARRSKAISANPLDEIAGIGPARKRALLQHFGSAKAVSRASTPDLLAVGGISAQMAQTIYDFFHERRD